MKRFIRQSSAVSDEKKLGKHTGKKNQVVRAQKTPEQLGYDQAVPNEKNHVYARVSIF